MENGLFESNYPKFEYKSARVLWPDTNALRSMSMGNINQSTDNFSMKYKNEATKLFKTEVCIKFIYINFYF